MLAEIFNLIYYPLFNLMIFFYNIVPGNDIGIAIILLTLFVRFVLYPMNTKSIKSQKKLQEIQPLMKEIQAKYKDNKEKQAKKLMELYQKHKINPLSGCLPILIQLPILIALYQVFLNGFKDESLAIVYPFIANPGHIDPMFIGLVNLSETNFLLALMAGILQFFQTKMLMGNKDKDKDKKVEEENKEKSAEEKTQDFAQSMTKQMMYILPIMTFVFAMSFPSGLALYWVVTTLFAIIQQFLIMKKQDKENQQITVIN
ncbi:MAG: YidC/Oxa1 family membrane protein insertase [Candidatus Pacebacteria bacterium]|nr:YidC/Oxa1 family membrane protein insertase [Candidatus Paceibacterota bacterium]